MMPFESDWKNKLLGIQTRWFLCFMNNDHCRRSRYLQCIFVLIYCVSVHNHYFHVKGACTSYTGGGGGGGRLWWGSSGEVSAAAAPVRTRPANWYSYFISTISLVLDEWWVFYLNIQLQLKRHKLSALGELFEDEDRARQKAWWAAAQVPSPPVRTSREKWICTEASLLYYLLIVDPMTWWWEKRDLMPVLANIAPKYLCVQASSTPSERVSHSAERASISPEKADMLLFLKKNS